ncbi:hypothetical protein [Pedobacter sp. SYSU D00535]|uniref:hypothetical protein n=1 Tax=Pedobacter sp. SYSU D00535 TaxID=2810308 RepID=UPI001A95F866|nr:hypothetical protein [Pedobacter sp. SYSU D00535]
MRIGPALKILSVFLLSNFFTSCTHYYYAPNSNNTPLFREKNELSLRVHSITGSRHTGGEVQAAYAVGKHTAVMFNYFRGTNERQNDYDKDEGKGSFAEVGGGVFFPLQDPNLVFESYGGFGRGKVTNIYGTSSSEVSYSRFFLQPNIGHRSKHLDFGLSSRFALANMKLNDIQNAAEIEDDEQKALEIVATHKHLILWEPGFMCQVGWEPLKLRAFLYRSYNLTRSSYPQDDFILGIGLNLRFNTAKLGKGSRK